jgi:hypothetical protein
MQIHHFAFQVVQQVLTHLQAIIYSISVPLQLMPSMDLFHTFSKRNRCLVQSEQNEWICICAHIVESCECRYTCPWGTDS